MLKKSAANCSLKRSVMAVSLPSRKSRFQKGKPRSGLPRPVRPSWLIIILRNLSIAVWGLANTLIPEPPAAGSPPRSRRPIRGNVPPCNAAVHTVTQRTRIDCGDSGIGKAEDVASTKDFTTLGHDNGGPAAVAVNPIHVPPAEGPFEKWVVFADEAATTE